MSPGELTEHEWRGVHALVAAWRTKDWVLARRICDLWDIRCLFIHWEQS